MFSTLELIKFAKKAAEYSYSPYSKFRVGCAVLGDNGNIYRGCNIENASYGLTICAERCAIFKMIADGCKSFTKLAVVCIDAEDGSPSGYKMPCGACLQVMAEFGYFDSLIIVENVNCFRLRELLPHPFTLKR